MKHVEKKWNILRKTRLFLRKIVHLFVHPSFYFSIRPFLCHLDLSRKKWNILRNIRKKKWEQSGYFWEKSGYFWEKSGYFWETYGSNQNSGRALCEKPYRSSSPFCAPQQVWKLLRNVWINFGWDFTYTHTKVSLASKTWTFKSSTKW